MRRAGRLSDTEALVREGINPPGPRLAPIQFGERGADNAVGGHGGSRFRRETGAGGEAFKGAKDELDKC